MGRLCQKQCEMSSRTFLLHRQGEKLDSQVSLHIVWDHGTEFWRMECASKGCEPRHPLAFLVRPQCLVVLRDGRS